MVNWNINNCLVIFSDNFGKFYIFMKIAFINYKNNWFIIGNKIYKTLNFKMYQISWTTMAINIFYLQHLKNKLKDIGVYLINFIEKLTKVQEWFIFISTIYNTIHLITFSYIY